MKKNILLIATGAMLFGSCVTFGKYEALESNHTQLRRDFNAVQGELNDLREENAELQRQNQSLNSEIVDLNDNVNKQAESNKALRQEIANYKRQYDEADKKIVDLENNPKAVEKIARERYHMKRANEDVFVFVGEPTETASEEEEEE